MKNVRKSNNDDLTGNLSPIDCDIFIIADGDILQHPQINGWIIYRQKVKYKVPMQISNTYVNRTVEILLDFPRCIQFVGVNFLLVLDLTLKKAMKASVDCAAIFRWV